MFTRTKIDRFSTRVFTGLVVAATILFGSLTHAVVNFQAFA